MNRGRFAGWATAALAASCCCTAAAAKDPPKPNLTIDPVVARTLLAPIDDVRDEPRAYRLDPGPDPASGQRARLSLDVGDTTFFAITGRLARVPASSGPLDPSHARALGQRRADTGKVYGAGVARTVHGVDLSATYQYSKLHDERPDSDDLRDMGPGRSHSLRATARIRF